MYKIKTYEYPVPANFFRMHGGWRSPTFHFCGESYSFGVSSSHISLDQIYVHPTYNGRYRAPISFRVKILDKEINVPIRTMAYKWVVETPEFLKREEEGPDKIFVFIVEWSYTCCMQHGPAIICLNNVTFPDMTIVVPNDDEDEGDMRLSVNRCVLAAHSKVFAAAFESKMKESVNGEYVIQENQVSTFGIYCFIKCFYDGWDTSEMGKVADEIYYLAQLYDFHFLKHRVCMMVLDRVLTVDIFCSLFKMDCHVRRSHPLDTHLKSALQLYVNKHVADQLRVHKEWVKLVEDVNTAVACGELMMKRFGAEPQ